MEAIAAPRWKLLPTIAISTGSRIRKPGSLYQMGRNACPYCHGGGSVSCTYPAVPEGAVEHRPSDRQQQRRDLPAIPARTVTASAIAAYFLEPYELKADIAT
ncbi:hypothetical protein SAMN05216241_103148 [Limimonas halophila]|uniref:Uncharacterized protein n=1 Tax=Limimonas halophila TaxID=1082479 RepID=A0A1G7Q1N2_9PROT|nr:hypothetical protein [Limimonas halophila]SDF91530.1 hypothetical protein SAMN05216241_103148 [Limimonas halophila]